MKKIVIFKLLLIICICVIGCNFEQSSKQTESNIPVSISVWETHDKMPWKFILGPEGAITEVFRNDGLQMVIKEGSIEMQPADNVFAYYEFGPCTWKYDSETNTLRVIVTFSDVVIIADQAELNCGMVDEFYGPLSEDGKIWTAEWKTTTTFDPETPKQKVVNGTLTFFKIK